MFKSNKIYLGVGYAVCRTKQDFADAKAEILARAKQQRIRLLKVYRDKPIAPGLTTVTRSGIIDLLTDGIEGFWEVLIVRNNSLPRADVFESVFGRLNSMGKLIDFIDTRAVVGDIIEPLVLPSNTDNREDAKAYVRAMLNKIEFIGESKGHESSRRGMIRAMGTKNYYALDAHLEVALQFPLEDQSWLLFTAATVWVSSNWRGPVAEFKRTLQVGANSGWLEVAR